MQELKLVDFFFLSFKIDIVGKRLIRSVQSEAYSQALSEHAVCSL